MKSFGQLLRFYRRRCNDPLRGGLLTQERLGELIGAEIGDAGYSGAAVSDWERDKSKISADDRLVLVAIVTVLNQCGGLQSPAEADEMLRSGNYRALDNDERLRAFPNLSSDSDRSPIGPDAATIRPAAQAQPPATLSRRRQKQLILLQKVKSFWVEGVLEKSRQEASLIALSQRRINSAIDQPWVEVVGPAAYDVPSSAAGESILETYMNIGQALLILGEPGSGKTTALIELAGDLIQRAESAASLPVPVIFNLVSWSASRQSLDNWVVQELTAKYQIPRKAGRTWLERDELILLLDGFDEVPDMQRARCAQAINQFRSERGLTGIVVCSRTEEYESAGVPLRVGGAVEILPLDSRQIDGYLAAAGSRLSALRAAVKQSSNLAELARSPLMLSIMGQAYSYSQEDLTTILDDPPQETAAPLTYWRRHLVGSYVNGMFDRRAHQPPYQPEETTFWLSWLARKMFDHNQGTFLVEQMQPGWLRNGRWRWTYIMLTGLLVGMVGGVIVWLLLQLLRESDPLLPAPLSSLVADFLRITQGDAEALTIIVANVLLGLVVAVLQGFYFEQLRNQQTEMESFRGQYWRHLLMVGVVVGLLTTVTIMLYEPSPLALIWGVIEVVLFVAVARFVYGRSYESEIRTVEALGWSWTSAAGGLIVGLILAFIAEALGVLIYSSPVTAYSTIILGIGGVFLGGLRGRRVEVKSRPNQGIYLSLRNSFIAATLSALLLGTVTLLVQSPKYALLSSVLIFAVAGSLLGGSNVIKHFIVRTLLWIAGDLPFRFVVFLNYSAGLTFLRKVGGGYIFGHRLILLYFAALNFPDKGDGQSGAVETAGIQRAIDRALSKS